MVLKLCTAQYFGANSFENDVEMYGAQTALFLSLTCRWFENDVEMYGAQTSKRTDRIC